MSAPTAPSHRSSQDGPYRPGTSVHPRSTGSAEDPSASCLPIVGGTLLLLEYQAAQLPAPHQDMQLSAQPRQHFACRPHRPPHRLRTHLRGRGMNNYEQFVSNTIPSRSHRSMQHIAPTLHDIHQHPLLFSPFIDAAFVNSDQNLPSSLIAQIRRHMQCPDRVLIRAHCRHVALSSRMLGSCKTSVTALVTALPKARDTTGSQWNSEEKSWATCGGSGRCLRPSELLLSSHIPSCRGGISGPLLGCNNPCLTVYLGLQITG